MKITMTFSQMINFLYFWSKNNNLSNFHIYIKDVTNFVP